MHFTWKKAYVNITSLIMVYKTVLLCIRHERLLICCQMRRQSSYHLSGHRTVQTYIRLIAVFVRWYKTESTKRRLITLTSWSNKLWGCAMRWNRLSISDTKDFRCVFELAAVILKIWCDFVLAALSVFVDNKAIGDCISAKLAKQQNGWLWASVNF